jgi:hypothetical protein
VKLISILSIAVFTSLVLVAPTAAKSKSKSNSSTVRGVYCAQGPESIFIGASRFKPNVRKSLRKGMRKKINIAGYGPLDCVVQ